MKRRSVIIAAAGIVPLSGCSLSPSESDNIQIANQTGQEVWTDISIQSEGGLLSDPQTVYQTRTRQPPTSSYRSTLTDVVPPGEYEVTVTFESVETEQQSDPRTTQWNPTGEASESLIISLGPNFDVEFFTQ
ncbi:hypothetical protein [Haloarcula sebkhae]|uniref:Uncharacterized protein n=2 Tax=Haloarcula sebkhae TaxID=932660 RepID=A0ACC6VLC5_9EURY|nr:hypothetical protein [Haloarcula sebkhae]GGK84422.1 hypothetical protein GCM10009067_40770 [Haloarcula sebkhae]